MGFLRIRLARFGRTVSLLPVTASRGKRRGVTDARTPASQNLPFFRIWVAESTTRRQGKHLEQLGYFDPMPGAWLASRLAD